jgi:hypothetical protein
LAEPMLKECVFKTARATCSTGCEWMNAIDMSGIKMPSMEDVRVH